MVASSDKDFMYNVIVPTTEKQGCKGSLFWDAGANVYKLKITDERLWEKLTGKYNIPTGEKSKEIEPPGSIDLREKRWHIRGWFDGDGWVEEMVKERGKKYSYPRVGIKTMSLRMRDWIADSIREENIRISTYDRKDGSHGLWINGFEECEKFLI